MSLDDIATATPPPDAPPPMDVEERLIATLDAHGAALKEAAALIAKSLDRIALALRQR